MQGGPRRVFGGEEERLDAKSGDRSAISDAINHLHAIVPIPEGACAFRPRFLVLADTANYIDRLCRENEDMRGRDRLADWLTANGQKSLEYVYKFLYCGC